METDETLLARRFAVLGRNSPLFYDRPLHIVSGKGAWLQDADGRRYLDAYNNVPHVGHCHPHVVAALSRQAARLNIHTRYLHESVVRYAERLIGHFDAPLSRVLFCCTGTEANELALRIARTETGGTGVIVTGFSYHGNSGGLAELTSGLPTPEPFSRLGRAIALPDPFRARPGTDMQGLTAHHVARFRAAVASLEADGIKLAAVLFDSIFSTEGLIDVPIDYIRQVVAITRAAGGLFIADEVQPGFGRMGDTMWGYSRYGIVPDIVTLGKPMGNGHPVAAVITHSDLADRFGERSFYFNTFGGNPVSAEVGMAVLDVIEGEGLVSHAGRVGARLQLGLRELAVRHEVIGDVRGRGLFAAVELVRPDTERTPDGPIARMAINAMRDRGILMSYTGPGKNVLKIRPPLAFGMDEADLLLTALDEVLGQAGGPSR